MSTLDTTKNIYLIVHGRKQLLEEVKEKLVLKGFEKDKMQTASLERAGNMGEYVAMIWPPSSPKEIIVSEITETGVSGRIDGMGAWASVNQNELYRIPLN